MTTKIKSRFMAALLALVCMVGILPTTTAHAASANTSGYAMARGTIEVFSDASCQQHSGWIYDYEGLTVTNVSGNVYSVNYSTSSNASGKSGYIKNPQFRINHLSSTCAGTVSSNTSVYGGPQPASPLDMGSLSAGEKVAVIYSEGGWYYVEYNTTGGRKRGYVPNYTVNADFPSVLGGFPQTRGPITGYSLPAQAVYGGPSDVYATIGSLSNNEWVSVYDKIDNGQEVYYYIGYMASGYPKFGYICIRS